MNTEMPIASISKIKLFKNFPNLNCSYRCQCPTMCGKIDKILFCHVAIVTWRCPRITIIQRNLSHKMCLTATIISTLHLISLTLFVLRSLTYINTNMTRITCYNGVFRVLLFLAKLKGIIRRQNAMRVAA